jgi:ABC-type glycerol-3-phosphate transport system substrate-binding protein
MIDKKKLSRRDFLRLAASSAAGATVIANVPAVLARNTNVAQGFQGTMQAFAGGTLNPNQPRGEGLEELTAYRAIADEWEAMNPGVNIEFIELSVTGDQYLTWIKSNQAAGTTPDIMYAQDNYINRDVEGGGSPFWIPLNDYIEEPNPYAPEDHPGATKWRDGFVAGFDSRGRSVDGNFYMVPQSFSAVQVLVNTTLLDEVGIDRSNLDGWTFDEMLGLGEQITQAGKIAWATAWAHPYDNWIVTSSLGGFMKATGRFATLDKDGDDFVDVRERWQGILDGDWGADTPEMRAMWQLAADWSPYYMPGYLGATQQEAEAMFLRGETAFFWNGTWFYPTIKNDPQRSFEYDVVRFPLMNARMAALGESPEAHNHYPGGAADNLTVTGVASEKGTIDLAVDFMRYATTPDAASRIAAEQGGIPPVVIGAVGNPELERFQPREGETFLKTIHMRSMNAEYGDLYLDIQSAFISGMMSMDDALAQFQEAMERFAKDAMGVS